MKKLILVVFLMLLMASSSWAAGTVVISSDTGKNDVRIIVYTVTFGGEERRINRLHADDVEGNCLLPGL